MKFLIVLVATVVAVTAVELDWKNAVPIHEIPEWRAAFPILAMRYPLTSSRIVNGHEAALGQFPYQARVALGFTAGTGLCGGSVISPEWILTAAHCIDRNAGILTVGILVGAISRENPGPTAHFPYTLEVIWHPQWNPNQIEQDVGVVHTTVIPLSAQIQPISLALAASGDFAGELATVSGWGRTGDGIGQGTPDGLRWVELRTMTVAACTAAWGSSPTVLCAETTNGGSTCSGDSGGPLTLNGAQIGIVSFGAAAGCTLGHPVGFARVSSFRPWITTTTGV